MVKNQSSTLLQIHDERFSFTLSFNSFNVVQSTFVSVNEKPEQFDFPDYHCMPHQNHCIQLLFEFNIQNQTAQITLKIGSKSNSFKVDSGIGSHNSQRTRSKFSLGVLGNSDARYSVKGVIKDFIIAKGQLLT